MTAAAIGLLLVLVLMSYGTAVVPLGPPEAYVLALTVTAASVPWGLAVALAATVGQVAGKLTVFLGVRGSLRHRSRRLDRVVPQRLLARLAERDRAHPAELGILVAISALASVPPLIMVAPAAGTTSMRPRVFAAAAFAGRLGRFAAIALVPALLR
jgi:membrane protein YqaA with SNARE-associated domain